jgi:hypothetical protein
VVGAAAALVAHAVLVLHAGRCVVNRPAPETRAPERPHVPLNRPELKRPCFGDDPASGPVEKMAPVYVLRGRRFRASMLRRRLGGERAA